MNGEHGRGREDAASSAAAGEAGGFLPSFCRVGLVFAVVVSAELLAFVLAIGAEDSWAGMWQRLSLLSLYVQWIALASAASLCLLRLPLQRLGRPLEGVTAWVLIQLVAAAVAVCAEMLLPLPEWTGSAAPGGALVPRTLAVSGIVGALLLRYLYLHHQWQRQVIAESSARFQALQARIRPHFLFNSMNTIAGLTRSDPALAEELVQDLSDLFRASLEVPERRSTLGRELDLARRYLAIEAQRLGRRLRVEWDLEALPLEAPLPPLVLQPLLENAVYHGVEPRGEGGTIRINGRYRRDRVNLSIRNPLPAEAGGTRREGNRMAVDNIRQRLAAMFAGRATLSEGLIDGDFQVRLVFPCPWKPL